MITLQTPEFSRDMQSGEEDAVDALLRSAFPSPVMSLLVHKLRKSRGIAGETVLPMRGRVVGYYALSHMVQPRGWLALATVAIHPEMQQRGYGKRMMGVLTEWARLTNTPVVVVGEPAFFAKSGFSVADKAWPQSPCPPEHLMVAGLGTQSPAVDLVFPAAFKGL
ncbi:GNAT family N-acetyltransferase [Yoonia sp.]|uniref:GNAT family N-acetyltransferase n=1 Tax=Yoonia sp. TaxID=2212373 RepID=UPI001A0A5B2E|nr:N-acetyltransferase [Yoonia sp.]MBE0413481.1 N-acetyltransferase [Yoonia sp.]